MPPESPSQYERIQSHLEQEQSWADSAREDVGFWRAGVSGFSDAAAQSFDADHWLESTTKLGLSVGAGLAMAKFAPARGLLGQVAKAGSTAMGLSLATEVLTKSDEISAAWEDSSKAGGLAGRFAFDAALMTAGGVGGHKLGGRLFGSSPSSGMSLPSKEFHIGPVESNGPLKATSVLPHELGHDRVPLDFSGTRPFLQLQPGRAGSIQQGIAQHEFGHGRMAFDRVSPVAAEANAHQLEIPGGFSKPSEPSNVMSEVGNAVEWIPQGRPSIAMEPKAYKVLTRDGASPWARDVKWSLPTQAADGSWIPGEWMQARPHPHLSILAEMVSGQPAGSSKVGLYVSDNPRIWKNDVSIPGNVVYEVEIGDAASIASWKAIHSGDFTSPLAREALAQGHIGSDFVAQQVRLRHPVSAAELAAFRPDPNEALGIMAVARMRGERLTQRLGGMATEVRN